MLTITQSIADSAHITIGSLHIEILTFTHIETYKFEKRIWNIYCNVCTLKMFIDNSIGP